LRSFEDRLTEVDGFGPGFDVLRLALCYLVLVWHAWVIGVGSTQPGKASPAWLPFELMVPMFFALSGFLVAGSSLRLATGPFLLNRALRIFPALAAAVLLAALVIGPLMTTLPLAEYFTHPEFAAYFLNMAGILRYTLPGVFETALLGPGVNGSLWTVPWEIGCYLVMASAMVLGLARRGGLYLIVSVGWLLAAVVFDRLAVPGQMPDLLYRFLRYFLASSGGLLMPYFLAGAAMYHLRARLPWDGRIAAVFAVLLVIASLTVDGTIWSRSPLLALLAMVPAVYLVPYLGLVRMSRPPGFRGGDYSYGVYVCHFPIVQMINESWSFGDWRLLLLASFVPVTLFAMASWHFIESPILAQRKKFSLVGRRIAAEQAKTQRVGER
jgi:peptidoglycan/LPS O-acetylase OafA/YrhL